MTLDLQQYLRLEVERDPEPGELINLVENPSGALGAWFWETPVVGSVLRSGSAGGLTFLTYQSPGGVASYCRSVPMSVAAGKWVSARVTAIAVNGQYRLTVEWLNASRSVIGSTTQSAAFTASSTPRAYGSFQAPAGTYFCRLRVDHYNGSGGNPDFGVVSVRDVVVTAADTAGELGWTRTNLLPNPSAEAGTTYWSAENASLDTSSTAWTGTKSFRLTKGAGKTGPMAATTTLAATPGRDYALQVRSRPGSGQPVRDVTLAARWLDAGGKQVAQATVKTGVESSGAWAFPLSGVATAPSTATQLQMRVVWSKVPADEVHLFDVAMVEQASKVGSYFDGDSVDVFGVTHAWTGTPGLSTSTQTGPAGDPGELVPVPYQNILGPTSSISIDREELNVGSMSVRLYDAVLDPTQNDLIQMGRRIRLIATPPADEEETPDPQVLFAGKVFTGSVTYHLLHPDAAKRAEVTLTAVDPINPLASTPSREGVAAIADLPHVLEGAGVPWSVNGDGNQVAAPDVVAYNDNASALDQVAVTRDSALGYAWIDRNGVLQAWDRDLLDSTVAAALDEDDYTADLDIDFDLDSLINSVTIKLLRVIATTGATEEVTFGPYVHAESYRNYGERAREFVVQGIAADDLAGIQDYAEAILDANALPRLRVNELVLPVAGGSLDAPDLGRAVLDLYDLVEITNERAGINEAARIRRIHHEISATNNGARWRMTLGFTAEGSVASPVAVPAPPPSVGEVKDELEESVQGAITAANGKNKITGATRAPNSSDPGIEGDTWYHLISGNIYAVYTHSGTAWVARKLRDETIDTLSVGKIAGLDAAFLNARITYLTSVNITSSIFTAAGGGTTATLSASAASGATGLGFIRSGSYFDITLGSLGAALNTGATLTLASPSIKMPGAVEMSPALKFYTNDLPTTVSAPNLRVAADGTVYKNENVSYGPNDSAGTGYRVLRVPN